MSGREDPIGHNKLRVSIDELDRLFGLLDARDRGEEVSDPLLDEYDRIEQAPVLKVIQPQPASQAGDDFVELCALLERRDAGEDVSDHPLIVEFNWRIKQQRKATPPGTDWQYLARHDPDKFARIFKRVHEHVEATSEQRRPRRERKGSQLPVPANDNPVSAIDRRQVIRQAKVNESRGPPPDPDPLKRRRPPTVGSRGGRSRPKPGIGSVKHGSGSKNRRASEFFPLEFFRGGELRPERGLR